MARLVLCGLLAAALTGCGLSTVGRRTAPGCAAVAVRAAERHLAISRLPVACRGLDAAGLSQAVRIAVTQLAGRGDDKARRRHMAGIARVRLGYLISAAAAAAAREATARRARRAAARSARPGPVRAGSAASAGWRIPADVAALLAWLVTAGSGSVLLAGWLARARERRRRMVHGGRAPLVLVIHFGLASAGLAIWVGYLMTSWSPLAWAALGVLLPVAGLGMATLVRSVPDPQSAPPAAKVAPARPPVVVIAAHGVLATVTFLLVLLAATATMTR